MRQTIPFSLQIRDNASLYGLLSTSDRPGPRPTVVVCHGFKGFMEWGFFPHLATLLSERGFTVVRFNFCGSGMRPGDELVTDLESFRRATFSQDLEDVVGLLEHLQEVVGPDVIDTERLGLFGHSRGGGIALLAAAQTTWLDRIGALVTWSAVGTFDRSSDAEKLAWRQRGTLEVTNARTGQVLAIERFVLDDLITNRDKLDLLTAAATRQAPWLLIHGDEDETVPIDEARDLAEVAAGEGCLIEIPGANHTFGAVHPFAGPTPALITALNATQSWFRQHL